MKKPNCLSSQSLKNKEDITLYHPKLYSRVSITLLHPKLWIFIQVNSKLEVGIQSITMVIVYSAKYAFENFRMQNVI